jgi:hypothetical protein
MSWTWMKSEMKTRSPPFSCDYKTMLTNLRHRLALRAGCPCGDTAWCSPGGYGLGPQGRWIFRWSLRLMGIEDHLHDMDVM